MNVPLPPGTINLGEVSPSGWGDLAACPMRLVFASNFPEDLLKEDETYAPHRNFGTVCHYHSQITLGNVINVPKKYDDATYLSARECPGVPKTSAFFTARVEACCAKANSIVRALSPCPPGVHWIAEHRAYTTDYLPTRVGRSGAKGFGGSVDLLMSDLSILWDYKFVSRIPEKVKNEYVWQLVAYHLATGVRKTGIIFTERSAAAVAYCIIDWADPTLASFVEMAKRFLKFVESPLFAKLAWPVLGDHCMFCKHKHRCPLQRLPAPQSQLVEMSTAPNPLDDLLKNHKAATQTTMPPALLNIPAIAAKPAPPMPPPPPPPPKPPSTTLVLPPAPPAPPSPPVSVPTVTNERGVEIDPFHGILG